MPREEGYLLACAPAGVGALGGQFNNDPSSPNRYDQRNVLTGESDAILFQGMQPTNGINLFGFGSTGHMIPVIEAVGDEIDQHFTYIELGFEIIALVIIIIFYISSRRIK